MGEMKREGIQTPHIRAYGVIDGDNSWEGIHQGGINLSAALEAPKKRIWRIWLEFVAP